ncbi:hypothetical protein LRO55_13205 [Acinetobacter calcoaceticus]|nr:hypothetical protein [Acinetobacter calcoaceticus]UGQ25325.1 hypothetical protein LRO55_13205 [Acinetobacter calcoaceticus]
MCSIRYFYVEVPPVFQQEDGSYKYPDTYNGGSWKITKPQAEIDEMKVMNNAKNRNLRRLCKMVREWKNIWWLGHSYRKYSTLCSIVSDFELAPTN